LQTPTPRRSFVVTRRNSNGRSGPQATPEADTEAAVPPAGPQARRPGAIRQRPQDPTDEELDSGADSVGDGRRTPGSRQVGQVRLG